MRQPRKRPGRLLAGMALLALGATASVAAVLTVDDDGTADFPSIQSAINAATNGDEIVVRPGRYRETLNFLGKSITVRSERGPAVTTVFLERETRIVLLNGDSTLEGFTITGGQSRIGGGILVTDGADPVIRGNVIEDNVAQWNDFTGFPGLGGGIAIDPPSLGDPSEPVITRNVIRNNRVVGDQASGGPSVGGGIDVGDQASPVVTSNVIVDNQAFNAGGGIAVGFQAGYGTPAVVANNTILGNASNGIDPATDIVGGGMSVYFDASLALQNNILAENTAADYGGGIYFYPSNDAGIDFDANDFDANAPDDCDGLPASKCSGGQFFFPALLQDRPAGNFRLRSDSELVDLGVSGSQGSLDADGRPRTVDGLLDGTAEPDIGAFENQGELTRLRFTDEQTLTWDGSRNAAMVFDVYRDALSMLGPGTVGTCFDPGLAVSSTVDSTTPAISDGFLYLVAGRDVVAGSLGFDGTGAERTPTVPCP